jgi:CheY-like chemotaxis protein
VAAVSNSPSRFPSRPVTQDLLDSEKIAGRSESSLERREGPAAAGAKTTGRLPEFGGRTFGNLPGSESSMDLPADTHFNVEKEGNLVLLVEDNRADVFLVEQAIEFHQVPVRLLVAEDGEEACQYFERADHDEHTPCPEVVLLDLNLPKRSGAEVLARVRTSQKCRDVPVVILTSSDSLEDRREASRLGADRYFRKPTSYREFLGIGAVLNEVLKEREH